MSVLYISCHTLLLCVWAKQYTLRQTNMLTIQILHSMNNDANMRKGKKKLCLSFYVMTHDYLKTLSNIKPEIIQYFIWVYGNSQSMPKYQTGKSH